MAIIPRPEDVILEAAAEECVLCKGYLHTPTNLEIAEGKSLLP